MDIPAKFCDHIGIIRVMAVRQGYAMARRPGCLPFVVAVADLLDPDGKWKVYTPAPESQPETARTEKVSQ